MGGRRIWKNRGRESRRNAGEGSREYKEIGIYSRCEKDGKIDKEGEDRKRMIHYEWETGMRGKEGGREKVREGGPENGRSTCPPRSGD